MYALNHVRARRLYLRTNFESQSLYSKETKWRTEDTIKPDYVKKSLMETKKNQNAHCLESEP